MRLVLPGSRADAPGGEDNGLQREWWERVKGTGVQEATVHLGVRCRKSHTQPICNNVPRKT